MILMYTNKNTEHYGTSLEINIDINDDSFRYLPISHNSLNIFFILKLRIMLK